MLTATSSESRTSAQRPSPAAISSASDKIAWYRSTWAIALAGSLLMWAALPPLDWWPLAWLAPVPWLLLVRQERLSGRRPYRALWLAGFVFWLAALSWLTLPHWPPSFACLAPS